MNVNQSSTFNAGINSDDSDIDLRQYIKTLSRYKWSILSLSLIITAIAALYVYSLVPVYRSTAKLLLDPQKQNIVSIEEVYGLPNYFYEYYLTQVEIIRSRDLLGKVADRLELTPQTLNVGMKERQGFSFNWRSYLPDGWFEESEAPSAVPAQGLDTRESVISHLAGMVDVKYITDSQLVTISFDSHNPAMTAKLANTLAEVYIDSGLESRLETTRNASAWITEHLQGLKENVDKSSQALQAFLERESLVDAQGVDSMAVKKLDDASNELLDARRMRSDIEESYRQIRALEGQAITAYESVPAVLNNTLVGQAKKNQTEAERKVSELSKRYGPKHPKMIAANTELESANKSLQEQIRNVVDSVKKEHDLAVARESQLVGQMQSAKNEMSKLNRTSNEMKILEQELQSNRQLYDMFLNRFKETSITDDLQTSFVRIVERAQIPGAPYKPDTERFITVAFVVALMFSIFLVFVIETLDNTLGSSSEVENKLFLPVLGILPRLSIWMNRDYKAMRYYSDKTHSNFSENIRTIRTSILLNDIDKEKKIILVTSSVPEEGKSLVAVNLSLALGQMKKTLLIDADMRRPSVERVFDMARNKNGLTQFIAGTHELKDCLHAIEGENLHIMPAGQIPSNPLELLSSSRFEKTATGLLKYYDYIVFDSAPAIPVSDPVVLSRIADVTIYVVKAHSTPYQLARTGISKLQTVNANMLGVVLNQVNPAKRPHKYGYGESDYYSYYGYQKD